MVKRTKILWGVCGIGHGHSYRQLPLIEHFAQEADIMIFAYGESHELLRQHFKDTPQVKIQKVAVPYYVGSPTGLDFNATAIHPANQNVDFIGINAQAMAAAASFLGVPDLVISDYEPVSAQYAYTHNAPLVTLDQQSKYLNAQFPKLLKGCGYQDEIERLRLFFPKAHARLACSFFNVAQGRHDDDKVTIVPPVIRDDIVALKRQQSASPTVVMYLSAQQLRNQSWAQMREVLAQFPDVTFHVFGVKKGEESDKLETSHIQLHARDDALFLSKIQDCAAIISTAGHSLLSEAMMLEIPVYAVPLPLYEQQMNAKIIDDNGFGVAHESLNVLSLREFLQSIPHYTDAIRRDNTVLLKGTGQGRIIRHLNAVLHRCP